MLSIISFSCFQLLSLRNMLPTWSLKSEVEKTCCKLRKLIRSWLALFNVMTAVYLTCSRTLTIRHDVMTSSYRVDVLKRQCTGKQDGSRSGQNLRFTLYFVCF